MGNEFLVTGVDFVCAALTLVYIGRLLVQSACLTPPLAMEFGVSKVSLRGQQVARRAR
jgi:hypothetical protein